MSSFAISALERGHRRKPQLKTLELLAGALALDDNQRAQFEAAARSAHTRVAAVTVGPWTRASPQPAPNNLPTQVTPLIGRESDLDKIAALVCAYPLTTLVGAGGVGKTRLAIQAGEALLDGSEDGVWLVELAALNEPASIVPAIASTFSLGEHHARPLLAVILQYLQSRRLVLIVDNCEHLIDEAARVIDTIVHQAPNIRILATSREPLRIAAEHVYRVPSLAVPAKKPLSAVEARRYGAIALFAERAEAAHADFRLTDGIAPVVGEICKRLDGIPFAIELAAARVLALAPHHLLHRLDERFQVLTSGSRTALPRQQTMRALVDWSYDLLSEQEQRLFRRVAIFAGGWTLDTAETVCADKTIGVLHLLASLVEKSLVVAEVEQDSTRYRLLESTRAFALEKLTATGEREHLGRRHAECFLRLAEATRDRKGVLFAWRTGTDPELDNYRAALEWTLTQENDNVLGGAIAGALGPLWFMAGLGVEGRYWTELALERVDEVAQPQIVARLQQARAQFLSGQRSYDAVERALHLFEEVGDVRGAARAQSGCAFALFMMGQLDEASSAIAKALASWHELEDEYEVAGCLLIQAAIEWGRGDFRVSRELHTRTLTAFRGLCEESGEAIVLINLAELESADGHPEKALRGVNDALEILLRGKNANLTATALSNRAAYRIALGDFEGARESESEGLRLARQARNEGLLTSSLEHLALLAALGGDAQRAARLLGYVNAGCLRLGQQRTLTEKGLHDKLLAALHETLSEDKIETLATEGTRLSEDQAVAEALAV